MPLRRLVLVAGSGVLLALAFPEPHWGWLAWVALVPLLVVALDVKPVGAFGWGFLQGTLSPVTFPALLRTTPCASRNVRLKLPRRVRAPNAPAMPFRRFAKRQKRIDFKNASF